MLVIPSVPFTFGTALIGRAAYALVLLPLLYAVESASGSIALAGVALALYGSGASFLAPVRAWLVDRCGATVVLGGLVVTFAGAITGIAMTALLGGQAALMIVFAATAGVVAPPLGPTMRVAWGRLAQEPGLLRTALSLDAVIEELLYLAGPAIAGVALAFFAPGAVLLVPAFLVLVGGLCFVSSTTVRGMVAVSHAATAARQPSLLRDRVFVGLLIPALVAGGVSGTLSVSVPIVLADHGGSAVAGIALGLFAGGSAVGGLVFGALGVPGGAARQLLVLTGALLAASSLIAVVADAVGISIVLAAAGLFFSPIMIVAYVAAQAAGGERRQNMATTWVNTSHNIGASAGTALAGILIQAASIPAATAGVAVAGSVLIAVSALLTRRAAT